MKISYQEDTVVAFQISESGLFELFLFQSVEKAFFIDYFSVTCKLLMQDKTLFILHPNKPLNVLRRVKAYPSYIPRISQTWKTGWG